MIFIVEERMESNIPQEATIRISAIRITTIQKEEEMSREGVSFDQVAAVADCLVSKGVSPTIKSVRESLGTGSESTIHRHLKLWRESRSPTPILLPEVPLDIAKAINDHIARSSSKAMAEIEERLVASQSDANELAATVEVLNATLGQRVEEASSMAGEIDKLTVKNSEKDSELIRIAHDIDRERYSTEHARMEAAEALTKLGAQNEKLLEMSSLIEKLKLDITSESLARIAAEKDAAVIKATLDGELEKSKQLSQEKEQLIKQIEAERQSSQAARIEVAKLTNELELQAAVLSDNKSAVRDLQEDCKAERNGRLSAEKQVAVLEEKMKAAKQPQNTAAVSTAGSAA